MRNTEIRDYQKDKIEELYKAGASTEYIVQDQGISKHKLMLLIKERNLTREDALWDGMSLAWVTKEEAICDMYRDEVPIELISSQVLLSPKQILKILIKYGLKW